MNRNEIVIQPVDIVAVERAARAMQAKVVGELISGAWGWVVARLRRTPAGQTA